MILKLWLVKGIWQLHQEYIKSMLTYIKVIRGACESHAEKIPLEPELACTSVGSVA